VLAPFLPKPTNKLSDGNLVASLLAHRMFVTQSEL
jgi:hypothetical protein